MPVERLALLPSHLKQAGFNDFLIKCETMDDGRSVPAMPAAQREAARRGTLAKDKMLSKPLSEVSAGRTMWMMSQGMCNSL